MGRRVLIVEDERDIAELIKLHLGDLAHELTVASDGHAGLRHITHNGTWWCWIYASPASMGWKFVDICAPRNVTHRC